MFVEPGSKVMAAKAHLYDHQLDDVVSVDGIIYAHLPLEIADIKVASTNPASPLLESVTFSDNEVHIEIGGGKTIGSLLFYDAAGDSIRVTGSSSSG